MTRLFDGRFIHFQFERALTLGTEIQRTSLNCSRKHIDSETYMILSSHLLKILFQKVYVLDSIATYFSRTVTIFVKKEDFFFYSWAHAMDDKSAKHPLM